MPFKWTEFFSLAEELVNIQLTSSRDAVLRTAIGRAYYSAFNTAVEYCKHRQYQFHQNGKDHELVRTWLRDQGRRDLSHALYELHLWRKQVDYDDSTTWPLPLMWLSAQDRAQKIIEAVGEDAR